MLDERTIYELTGGGDTMLHYHTRDRVTNAELQSQERVTRVANDYYATYNDDILLIEATAPLVVTLPPAKTRRITLLRISGAGTITVTPSSGDTINGSASVTITSSYSPLRLKGVPGIGYVSI